jgi:hypothetical protein
MTFSPKLDLEGYLSVLTNSAMSRRDGARGGCEEVTSLGE